MLIRQSINYNMGEANEEQELLIPKKGENFMVIRIEPSVVGQYTVGLIWGFKKRGLL